MNSTIAPAPGYARSAFAAASALPAVASRAAAPSHVAIAARVAFPGRAQGDPQVASAAWTAKKGIPAPRGGPA